jgi:flagellar biosynthesis/type III secretory pathway protein FliH
MDNLVSVLVLMEQSRAADELRVQVDRAIELLNDDAYASLRRAFATMLRTVLAPARGIDFAAEDVGGLSEVRDMLAERVKEWTREWKAEGLAEGVVKGRAEGEAKGKADTLLRLLHRRFKVLPNGIEDRVRAADRDRLDEWLDRFVDAQTLAEVFGPEQPH